MANNVSVAKLVSYMGFEIDVSQLERFNNLTKGIRSTTVNLARNLRVVNNNLSEVNTKFKTFNKNHSTLANAKSLGNVSKNYASVSKNVSTTTASLNRMSPVLDIINPKLKENENRVFGLVRAWSMLASRIKEVNGDLRANKAIGMTSSRPTMPSRSGGGGTTGGMGGGAGAAAGGALAGRFLSSFSPAAALAGGAVTAGFAVKQVVDRGREWIKMKNVLTASTDSALEFNRALEFTERTTNRLGTNVTEFGLAYAKILQASKGKLSNSQSEDIFTSFSELSVILGSTTDDQKGIFRAISQMFSKGKIQMEEINQMAERQVPALSMLTRAYKELGMTQAEFEKAQREGKLDPTKFMPLMAKYAKEFANNQGALDKALNNSITQQGRFMNQVTKMSGVIMESGLDRLLAEMFKGGTKFLEVLQPMIVWLTQATLGLIELGKMLKKGAEDSKLFAAALSVAGLGLLAFAFRNKVALAATLLFTGGATAAFAALKVALIRTGIGAILVGIGYILAKLYQHVNGEKNWITVMTWQIKNLGTTFEVLGWQIKNFFDGLAMQYGNSPVFKSLDMMTRWNPTTAPFRMVYDHTVGKMGQQKMPNPRDTVPTPLATPQYQNNNSLLNWKPQAGNIEMTNNIHLNGQHVGTQKTVRPISMGGIVP